MTTRSKTTYQVEDSPGLDQLLDSLKYCFHRKGDVKVSFKVMRPYGDQEPVRFEMDNCVVLGIRFTSVEPLEVEVELYSPPMVGGQIRHNATATINLVRRRGTLDFFLE